MPLSLMIISFKKVSICHGRAVYHSREDVGCAFEGWNVSSIVEDIKEHNIIIAKLWSQIAWILISTSLLCILGQVT